ncbi:uncharacterized protein C20orf96 homolog isoform X2 [Heliangelus exortis]|uniref:uncharacterized protein C20orf96 homolog isoform X2 n=1 Tax=Heliangelus exortis TaxID=472823 RepID=UPI003A9137F7
MTRAPRTSPVDSIPGCRSPVHPSPVDPVPVYPVPVDPIPSLPVGRSLLPGVVVLPSERDPSATEEMERADGSKRQKADPEGRKGPSRGDITDGDEKKDGKRNEPEPPPAKEKHKSSTQMKLKLRKAELAKNLEEIEIIMNLNSLRKDAIEELRQRGARLAEANSHLVRDIQQTDESMAREARALLQQCEALQRSKARVQTSHQNKLDTARAELQEMEKTMEKSLGKLQQTLDEVTLKAQVLQDELRALQTYMDTQYPAQAAQTELLQHSIQGLKEQHQEERDKIEKMGKLILEELEEKTRVEQEALIQKIVEETLLHQDSLKQMVINNHILQCKILKQKEIIQDLEEEVGELKRSIQTLRQGVRDPREVIFGDVLLLRARCPPDPEVTLSIPREGTHPLSHPPDSLG